MKRHFEAPGDGGLVRFWDIDIEGGCFIVTFGSSTRQFPSRRFQFDDETQCQKAADLLIAEHTSKGYVEAMVPQAPTVRASSKPKKGNKANTVAGLSAADMKRAYEIYQGNFFEGSWMHNKALRKAFLAWAEETAPAGRDIDYGEASIVETYICDEEGHGKIADFVKSLPDALQAEALIGIRDDVKSMLRAKEGKGMSLLRKLASLLPVDMATRGLCL